MYRKTIFVLMMLIFIIIMTSCSSGNMSSESNKPNLSYNVGDINGTDIDIYRWHDSDYSVTCWIAYGWKKAGMSCIPDAYLDYDGFLQDLKE